MPHVRLAAVAILALLPLAIVSACSGGGSGNRAAPVTATPQNATLVLQFSVPARVASASGRRVSYVSTATASFGIFIAPTAALLPTMPTASVDVGPNCTPSGGGQTCSTTVTVPTGSVVVNVRAYAGSHATGAILGAGTTTVTIYANAVNHVALALTGIVGSIDLTFATPSAIIPVAIASATPAPIGVTVTARDLAGVAVVGAYADASGVPLTITLSASGGAQFSLANLSAATSGIMLDISAVNAATVAISASAGAIPVTTPAPLTFTYTAAGVVSTFAGTAGSSGSNDGNHATAHFMHPGGIAVDAAHAVYVADVDNDEVRKIATDGTVTTVAGAPQHSGNQDGNGSNAHFSAPTGVAADSISNAIYVADGSNGAIRKIASDGTVTTIAGLSMTYGDSDGMGASARFTYPAAIATDALGNLYVADSMRHTIRKITTTGSVSTLAGIPGSQGWADGTGASALFNAPSALVVDSHGNVYVADSSNDLIRKITSAGTVSTLAGVRNCSNYVDGPGTIACFDDPAGITIDSSNNLYVADTGNNVIRKVSPSGFVTTLAGFGRHAGSSDGTGAVARLDGPTGIAFDANGTLYVSDRNNHILRVIR